MSVMSDEVLSWNWKISHFLFFRLSSAKELKSPKIKIENFNCQWYLTLIRKEENKIRVGFMSCDESRDFLHQKIEEDSLSTLSCSLGIVDTNGKLLASMDRMDMHIDCGWFRFMDVELAEIMYDFEKNVFQIQCQLFDKNNTLQSVTCEALTEIQVMKHAFDRKIEIPLITDWSKCIECQIQDEEKKPISFDILLTAPDNKVFMNIRVPEEQNLPEVCQLKTSILYQEGVKLCSKISYFSLHSSQFETSIDSPFVYSFTLKCAVYVSNGSSNAKLVRYSY